MTTFCGGEGGLFIRAAKANNMQHFSGFPFACPLLLVSIFLNLTNIMNNPQPNLLVTLPPPLMIAWFKFTLQFDCRSTFAREVVIWSVEFVISIPPGASLFRRTHFYASRMHLVEPLYYAYTDSAQSLCTLLTDFFVVTWVAVAVTCTEDIWTKRQVVESTSTCGVWRFPVLTSRCFLSFSLFLLA